MRHQGYSGIRGFLLLLGFLLMGTATGHAETLRFVYFEQFEPFSWKENEQMRGIFIDVIDEALTNRLGISVTHEGYPWKRAQAMVQNGEADGMCTIITPERLAYAQGTTIPIITANFKMFTAANHPRLDQLQQVKTLQDLTAFKLVDVLGSGWAEQNLKDMDVHFVASYQQVFLLLESGRDDVAIRNDWQTRYMVKKLGFEGKIIALPQPMTPEAQPYSILIGKKSPFAAQIERLNAVLKQMEQDGTLQMIYNKYQ